jgi:hypothetical protein
MPLRLFSIGTGTVPGYGTLTALTQKYRHPNIKNFANLKQLAQTLRKSNVSVAE